MMKTILITSFIPRADIDHEFWASLDTFKKYNNSEFILLKCKENYTGDTKDYYTGDDLKDHYECPDGKSELLRELMDMSIKGSTKLNSKLKVLAMELNVNLLDPLSGMDDLTKHGCLVVGYPRHRFKTVPRSLKHSQLPRAIWCTGTVSEPYYKDTKSGIRVREYHKKGALVVTIENNKVFHVRQIEAGDDGSFYDLLYKYNPDGTRDRIDGIDSISLGDIHLTTANKNVLKSTMSLMKYLNPKNIFYHDMFDGLSINHHIEGKNITKALTLKSVPSLEYEMKLTASRLQKICDNNPNAKHYVVKSNHDEFLDRYLEEFRFRDDHTNLEYAAELLVQQIKFKRGKSKRDALEWALRKIMPLKNVKFLQRDSELSVTKLRIEMANHGDYGNNGARGTPKSQSLLFNGSCVTGHIHSPEITVFGGYVNGTCTDLDVSYTNSSGGSGWLNTHTIVYPNGARSHIHLIPEANNGIEKYLSYAA